MKGKKNLMRIMSELIVGLLIGFLIFETSIGMQLYIVNVPPQLNVIPGGSWKWIKN